MEILSAVLLTVSPYIASRAAESFKNLSAVRWSDERVAVIRAFIAVLSVATGALNALVTGGELDTEGVETAVNAVVYAFVTYVGAHGLYFFDKQKKGL